jgi:hypothetical protein
MNIGLIYLIGVLVFFIFYYDKALAKIGLSRRDGCVMFMGMAFFNGIGEISGLLAGAGSSALIGLAINGAIFYYFYHRAQIA